MTTEFTANNRYVLDSEGREVAEAATPAMARWIADVLNADTTRGVSDDSKDAASGG